MRRKTIGDQVAPAVGVVRSSWSRVLPDVDGNPFFATLVWEDAENVPVRTMKVSPKRAKIAGRAGPIWHYVALRGTTWHKSAPYM